MRKSTPLSMFLLLLYLTGLCYSTVVSAAMIKPEDAIGDYWRYTGNYYNTTATVSVQITERTNITIENQLYDVFVYVEDTKGTGIANAYLHRNQTYYARVSDLSIVKWIDYYNYTSDVSNETYAREYVFSPPLSTIQYPLAVGAKWQNNYTAQIIDLFSTNISEKSMNESYECERTSTEHAMDRDFSCYLVRKNETVQGQHYDTVLFMSPVVGSQPVRENIDLNGQPIISLILSDYHIANPGTFNDDVRNKTPGFEFILAVLLIAMMIFLKRRVSK